MAMAEAAASRPAVTEGKAAVAEAVAEAAVAEAAVADMASGISKVRREVIGWLASLATAERMPT